MHIYIDESGIFRNPANRTNIASCVAALMVPTTKKRGLFSDFATLTRGWADSNGEVKGKNLDEQQVDAVVSLLQRYTPLLELTVIDLGLHSDEDVTRCKEAQAKRMIQSLTSSTEPILVTAAHLLHDSLLAMSNQLYLQAFIMFLLIPRVIQFGILYYARQIPKELSWFYWMVDAKGSSLTAYEEAWSTALYPIIGTATARRPLAFLELGYYSYFSRRFLKAKPMKNVEDPYATEEDTIGEFDLGKILGDHFEFQDSRWNLGLQMADILANATQRALNNRLGFDGWKNIGTLMLRRDPNPIDLVRITAGEDDEDEGIEWEPSPFGSDLKVYLEKSKFVWT